MTLGNFKVALVLILVLVTLCAVLISIYIFALEEKPGRELEIAIFPNERGVYPGGELYYKVTIANRGTQSDIYRLRVYDNAGWTLALSDNLLEVPAGENKTVTFSVIIPENVAPYSQNEITVTATAQADPTAIKTTSSIASAAVSSELGVLTIAQSADADILDPARTVYDMATRVIALIYEPLLTYDYDMKLIGMLAESYDYNEAGMFYEFELKRGVTFHDGHPFTAEAVEYTIDRIRTLPGSKHVESVQNILDVVVVDNYTVRVYLEQEDRYLLEWFATVSSVIVCPQSAEEYGVDFGTPEGPPCGTGPFKFKDWVADDRITLERYENYTWGPERYQNRGPAHLDGIVFRVVPTHLSRETMFEQGEVDFVTSVRQDQELLGSWGNDPNTNIELYVQLSPSLVYLGFNTAGTDNHGYGELSDKSVPKKVRQAIAYAINVNEIIDVALAGIGVPAHSWLANPIWSSTNYQENMYPYNPENARQLLAEAGYPDGLTLDILTTSAPPYPDLAVLLREQLAEVGINLDIQVLAYDQLMDKITNKNFDMFIMGYTWPYADMIWFCFHTSRLPPGPNRFWWGDAYTDAIMENTFSFDDDVALEALKEAQRLIAEDAASIGLYQRATLIAHRAYVKGFRMHPQAGQCWHFLDTYKEVILV